MFPFLYVGVIKAFFQYDGKILLSNDVSKICSSALHTANGDFLSIVTEMPSDRTDDLAGRESTISLISLPDT